MKRRFSLRIWEHSFDNRNDYEALVSAFGADPGQTFVRFVGDEHDSLLLDLKRALHGVGHEECQNRRELGRRRYIVNWFIEFEASDYANGDFFLVDYFNCVMDDNIKVISDDEVSVGVNDEDLWEVKDPVIDVLFGDRPACFDGPGELYLCNEQFVELARQAHLEGLHFLDKVATIGENRDKVQQMLFVLDSDVQLPPMCPHVKFQDTNENVRENNAVIGDRFLHSETVPAYTREATDAAHFVDIGWTAERVRARHPFRKLVISKRFWDFLKRLGIEANVWPGKFQ
jgi:hypothetical protein